MKVATLRVGRDIARWVCVCLVGAALYASVYSVPLSPPSPCPVLGPPFTELCFAPSTYPLVQYSPSLFLAAILTYLLAREIDSKVIAELRIEADAKSDFPIQPED